MSDNIIFHERSLAQILEDLLAVYMFTDIRFCKTKILIPELSIQGRLHLFLQVATSSKGPSKT